MMLKCLLKPIRNYKQIVSLYSEKTNMIYDDAKYLYKILFELLYFFIYKYNLGTNRV